MLRRVLAAAATAWSVVYLVVYLWVIDAQEGAIAWWYVVLIVLAALSFALAALDTWARPAPTVGLVTSALAMLVGLLSLGALLAPNCRRGTNRTRPYTPRRKRTCGSRRTATESATRGHRRRDQLGPN